MDYSHRKIESLTELKPGDHIVVEESRANVFGRRKTHHLLIEKAIDHTHADVIHCVFDDMGERKRYLPRHVTVLDYETKKCNHPTSLGYAGAKMGPDQAVTLMLG